MSLLELRGITKRFGDLVANDRINLSVEPGRVHAIVGENGAGKTTLMTMIAGTARPTEGEILFDGEVTEMSSPQKAAKLGIGMVHQHFKLVPSLTVAANVFLGSEIVSRTGSLDTAAMEAKVAELSQKFGLAITPTDIVEDLSVGERQRVEVLKALSHDTRLLILDEPTAVLTPSEADELFVVVRELAKNGCAVLFISHKLDEVLAIADVVTVIRDGRVIATLPAAGLSEADIATMMVGREVLLRITHTEPKPAGEVLDVADLTVIDDRGVTAVNRLSLSVRAGEIVGIAGVEGNGQAELAEAISGLSRPDGGTVHLKGEDVTRASVKHHRELGLAYIPEDRHDVGTGPTLSVAENLIATHVTPPIARLGWVSNRATKAFADAMIKKFDIRGATSSTPAESLSGGNMQKVVIAREFEAQPALLMVSQPTRGVDVGAMEFVHNALVSARDAGAGVLLISADLTEVMSLSDRLLVIHRGRIVSEFTQETMTETAIGLAMAGLEADDDEVAKAEAQHEEIAQAVSTGEAAARSSRIAEAVRKARNDLAGDDEAVHGVGVAAPIEAIDTTGVRTRSPLKEFTTRLFANSVQPILAILVALLIGVFIIAGLGVNPLDAYSELFLSSFTSPQGIGAMIAQAVPLLILSAGVIISFRAGFFNIGGEGQLYVGALAGAWVGFTFKDLPGPVLVLAILAWAFVIAAIWGLIPGALLALWDVNIIVTTLMMSSIATLLTAFLVTGPMKDPQVGTAASPRVADQAMLPMISDEYGLGLDLVIALAIVVVMGLVLTRSVWGLRVRQLGELNRFADYTGVSRKAMSMQVMAISGGISGLAGALFVIGPNGGRFLQTFSPGYGFLAITVALLARLNPWASIIAAVFYANMMAGSNQMQINTNVPFPLVNVLQGLIILLITGTFAWNWRRRKANPGETAPDEPVAAEPDSSAPTTERSAA
ncbi:MAG: ATP-binding cassette domain-containing protein [Actinobacteria bacterium]|nr:ATP-binding cassette domain-containing protein [Actinomycetota bacterium]